MNTDQLLIEYATLEAEVREMLRNSTFQDGLGTVLTQDAEAVEDALDRITKLQRGDAL